MNNNGDEEEDEFDKIVNQFGNCKNTYLELDKCLDENKHSWVNKNKKKKKIELQISGSKEEEEKKFFKFLKRLFVNQK